jgi:septal ring factor EnvC (AmiA/AmiB activator)
VASKQEARQPPAEPLWVRLVHEFERSIAAPVEAAVRSDEYFDLVTQLNRARAHVTKTVESLSEEWLHLFNLPAATDLRRVREQLSRVERQLNKVAKTLGDSDEANEEPRRQLAQLERQMAEIAKMLGAGAAKPKAPRQSQRRRE